MALHGTNGVTVSRDGDYVVHTCGKELSVHSATPLEGSRFLQSTRLQEPLASQLKFVKVSQLSSSADDAERRPNAEDEEPLNLVPDQRILCATNNRISVWQVNSLEWHADIENIEPSVTAVDFGAKYDEAIIFHAWSSKATIFNLDSASSLVIKSPKFCNPNSQGYGYRPRTKQLAILLKPEGNDLLTIHEASSYQTISKVILPTVDAQGLKWSPDGKWIVVWDAASGGTKILIYTADGQHFRTYTGRNDVDNTHDLGTRCVEWAPLVQRQQNCEFLAVGKYDGTIDVLNTRTFSCFTTLSHTFRISAQSPSIWRERMSPEGKLEYAEAPSSSAFIVAGSDSTSQLPRGVSSLQFSSNGCFLASIEQTQPNIIWIWTLTTSPVLKTALVHEHNVRNMSWHARSSELLITTANNAFSVVHLWSEERSPVIAEIPIARSETGRYDVTWVKSSGQEDSKLFWFSTTEDAALGYVAVDADRGHGSFNTLHVVSRGGS